MNADSSIPATPPQETPPRPQPAIRWWPALLVVGLSAAYCVWVWFFLEVQRQDKNLHTMSAILVTVFLLLLWWLFLSRARWSVRLLPVALVVIAAGAVAGLFKVRGVTGDFLPIFEWRWKRSPPGASTRNSSSTPNATTVQPLDLTNSYPQILGPHRDGKLAGPKLARNWNTSPPVELWRHPMSAAWSGFAISGSYAITMEQRGDEELTTCYDLPTGALLWTHSDGARYSTTIAGEGPRTVPTIVGDSVYVLGATGLLNCLDLTSGKRRWSRNILNDHASSLPDWGVSGSPLVFEGKVVVSPGGKKGHSLAAYDDASGETVWSGGNDHAHYSSPVLATIAGVSQILIFNGPGVSSHDASSGTVLWKYPWRGGHPHVTMPAVLPDDRVLVSSGYGTGSELLQVTHPAPNRWAVTNVWKSNRLKSKFANLLPLDGYIYGLDDGILVCLELADGELKWKQGRYGHGQMILVDKLLLIMAENGELVLVEPVPQEARELTRFKVFTDKTWNPPALAGPYLLVRNDKEAACYRLPIVGP